jgi:serine/threonine protein kinase
MVMESLQRLDPPRTLGKFRLLARLGEGGMATVYVASIGHGALRRLAAVKLLRPSAPDHDYRTRFLDEARVVVRLHHNNIVDVREAGEVDGQLLIAMELIEGRDLADVWDRCAEVGRAFPVALAVHIVREALRGLHYAHTFPGLGLVHRDVSPSNVLIDWAGAVRLADFGLATSAMRAAHTVPGMVFGKVGYMAPEQATRSPLDGRADVYSCGVVLWELLTGRPLRESGTDTQAVAGWDAVPPSQKSSRVDSQLDAIVVRALQRDPAARYQTAQEFLGALSGWVAAHAPDTTQEKLSAFMGDLFGAARERDHAAYSELLERATSGAAEAADATDIAAAPPPRAAGPRRGGDEHIPAGTVVADRYRIEQALGQGGMGTVYYGEHVTVGRKVAVKVLTHEWSAHPTVARRFKEEARAASAAGHQNIVEVFDAGDLPDGRLYLVMELLQGRSLYEELQESGPFEIVRACRIMRQVARAVRAAHGVGIIHRDLKPDNVMLVDRGEGEVVKVLDFGISASADRTEDDARLTMPGHALGTPEYMAPEQAKGHPPTAAFDLYAMGVIFYEILCGEPPFVSQNILEVLTRKTTETPPPLDLRRPGLPPALVQLVHACIHADPSRRPPSVDAFLAALDPVLASLGGAFAIHSGPAYAGTGVGMPRPQIEETGTDRLPPPPVAGFERALSAVHSGPDVAAMMAAPAELEHTDPDADFERLPRGDAPRGRAALWAAVAGGAAIVTLGLVWWAVGTGPDPAPVAAADDRASALASEAATPPATTPEGAREPAADDGDDDEPPSPVFPDASGGDDGAAPEGEAAEAGAGAGAGAGAEAAAEAPTKAAEPAPSEPQPAAVDRGSPKSVPRAKADATDSPKCKDARAKASGAVDRGDYKGALASIGPKECWTGKHRADFMWIRTKSLFETRQFAACAKAGRSAAAKKTADLAETCAQRLKLESG